MGSFNVNENLNVMHSVPKVIIIMIAIIHKNINVISYKQVTKMLSDAISEHLFFKIFLGGHAPRPP